MITVKKVVSEQTGEWSAMFPSQPEFVLVMIIEHLELENDTTLEKNLSAQLKPPNWKGHLQVPSNFTSNASHPLQLRVP